MEIFSIVPFLLPILFGHSIHKNCSLGYDYLKKMSPNYFMPYAGFFSEKLKRDKEVLKYNKKNSIDDYLKFCELNKIEVLNVLKNDVYKFKGIKLINKKNIDIKVTKDLRPEKYLEYYKI